MSFITSPQRALTCFNVRDEGADPTGATESTTAIANARSKARAAGGGVVFYPPGTYISGNQDISNDANIYHVGAGKNATIIKLKNGANTDLFSGQTSLINIGDFTAGLAGTLYSFGFRDLTLDGNKAHQTAGTSWPLRFYGYDYTLENISVHDGYSGNILSDYRASWSAAQPNFVSDSMESQWLNVKTYNSGGIGVQYGGPHDSVWTQVDIFEEALHCLHIGPNAGGTQFINCHFWSPGWGVNGPLPGPAVYGYDLFQRANQSGFGTATDSNTYTRVLGSTSASIVSDEGQLAGSGFSLWQLGSQSSTDIDIMCGFNQGGDSANAPGLAWRITDANNYYNVYLYAGSLVLNKWVGGSGSQITTAAFSLPATANGKMRVRMVGTSIKIRAWQDGFPEPATWNITTTDSGLASGYSGLYAYNNNVDPISLYLFRAASIYTQSNCVSVLSEAPNIHFSNCQGETSDTTHVVALGDSFGWIGGTMFGANEYGYLYTSGIQIGQQAGQTPFPGQIFQSGGVTLAKSPSHYTIITRIEECRGSNGMIYFANDSAGNGRVIVTEYTNVDEGSPYGGVPNSNTLLDIYNVGMISGTGGQSIHLVSSTVSGAAPDPGANGIISTYGLDTSRVTPASSRTGVILQPGAVQGQRVTVVNASGANTITFAASNVSNVADGASDVIAANTCRDFRWDGSNNLWYPVK